MFRNKVKTYKDVYTTNYPIYSLQILGDRHVIVTGGGGQSKTGVPNTFEVIELRLDNHGLTEAVLTCKQDLGRASAMNSCILQKASDGKAILAVGADAECAVFSLKQKLLPTATQDDGTTVLRKRKTAFTRSQENENAPRMLSFSIEPVKKVRADHSGGDEGFQKSVCAAPDASALYTAGCDGCIRMWKLPEVEQVHEVKAHTTDIDELTISPDSKHVVSISKDRKAKAWRSADLSAVCDLRWEHAAAELYRYRACRFGRNERSDQHHNLFTIHVPVIANKQRSQSYLTKWSFPDYVPRRVTAVGQGDTVCALTCSDTGRYVGIATMFGGVGVHAAFSLQSLYWVPCAHEVFVTALAFAPASCAVNATSEFSLISASVDNTLKLHQLPARKTFSGLWLTPFLLLMMLGVFFLLSYLEL